MASSLLLSTFLWPPKLGSLVVNIIQRITVKIVEYIIIANRNIATCMYIRSVTVLHR